MKTETNTEARAEGRADSKPVRGRRLAAAILATVAVVALVSQHVTFSWRGGILLPMGLAFLVWAALARSPGLLVPGGVLSGLGVGLTLQPTHGVSALLFGLAGGFLLVAALSPLLEKRRGQWWPFFPAAGLVLAGLVTKAGPDVREWLRSAAPYWPFVLIGVALVLWLWPARKNS